MTKFFEHTNAEMSDEEMWENVIKFFPAYSNGTINVDARASSFNFIREICELRERLEKLESKCH